MGHTARHCNTVTVKLYYNTSDLTTPVVNSVRHCPDRGRRAVRLRSGVPEESWSPYGERDSKPVASDPDYMTSQN